MKKRLIDVVRWFLSIPCMLYLNAMRSKSSLQLENERLIVSLTSWTKRIANVVPVVNSILDNTIKPDLIVLNLSLDEFPNRENDLPSDLVDFIDNGVLEIIWNEGNSKAFKKFIPTLNKYPNDVVIAIDDDFLYPSDFIETFKKKHREIPLVPLVGNCYILDGVLAHCGCASLIKKDHFGKYLDDFLDDEIIALGLDDVFYTFCMTLNGRKYAYVGKDFYFNMTANNPVAGLSENVHCSIDEMRYLLIDKAKKKYNINLGRLHEPIFCL